MIKDRLDGKIKNPEGYLGLDLSLRGEEMLSRGESGRVAMAIPGGLQESKLWLWVPITGGVQPRLWAQPGNQPSVSIPEHAVAQLQGPFSINPGPRERATPILGAIMGVSKS